MFHYESKLVTDSKFMFVCRNGCYCYPVFVSGSSGIPCLLGDGGVENPKQKIQMVTFEIYIFTTVYGLNDGKQVTV